MKGKFPVIYHQLNLAIHDFSAISIMSYLRNVHTEGFFR